MPLDTKKDVNEKSGEINIVRIGQAESQLPSPIDLDIRIAKEIALPSLIWANADQVPRLMKISNSGYSVIVTAKWLGPVRPYITGSQLPGKYIFSQAHFHWGRNNGEGSEHTAQGVSQPLELHVMYFKTDYVTPESAMKEQDGIVVLAYLYNLRGKANTNLAPVIEALPKVVQPYTSSPIQLTPISKLAPTFTDDFYLYWGSVVAQVDYKIVWLIHRQAQTISAEQLTLFRKLIGANQVPLLKNFRDTKSVNGRTILFVNPGKVRDKTLIPAEPDPGERPPTPPEHRPKPETPKPTATLAQKRISTKRKSAVRRQSRKSVQKLQKSENSEAKSPVTDRHILNAAVLGSESPSVTESLSNVTNDSSSSTLSDSTDDDGSSPNSTVYDFEDIQKCCELMTQNQEVESSSIGDISKIVGSNDVSKRCDDLLDRLQTKSKVRNSTCQKILNDLERMMNENKGIDEETISESYNAPSHEDIDEKSSSPINPPGVHFTAIYKCPEMDFASTRTVPPIDEQQIITSFVEEEPTPPKLLTRRQTSTVCSRIPASLAERIRRENRKRSESSLGMESDSEKKSLFDKVMNETMLTSVWKRVTSPTGMIISNETMTVVTSQASYDDNRDRQNLSYLQQKTFLEMEPKPAKGKFQNQKVEKIMKRGSSRPFPMTNAPMDQEKRQTMVMQLFQNSVARSRKLKNASSPFGRARKPLLIRTQIPENKPAWKY